MLMRFLLPLMLGAAWGETFAAPSIPFEPLAQARRSGVAACGKPARRRRSGPRSRSHK